LDEFISTLPDKQHILVLNHPNNPTGVVYSRQELEEIANVCRKNNTLVLADEIYAITTYNFEDFTSMGLVYPEGTFVTNGLSKDRSAGGYRMGYCILPENSTEQLKMDFRKVAATVYTNVSTPTQYAAVKAYEPNPEIEEYFRITREIHRMIGQFLSAEFNKIPGIKATTPHGGFYFYVDFNELADGLRKTGVSSSNDLANSLISHPYHFAAVTGDSVMLKPDNFGARIAFVDYNGKMAYENYKQNPPKSPAEEIEFVKQNASIMVKGVNALNDYVNHIKGLE
jgi:aspartate aminotransferase